jgi:hypothetical protein
VLPDETIRAYDEHAGSWAAKRSGPRYWESALGWLREELPAPARIIEFGTGTGCDGAALIEAGYDYTGLDASRGMLELARRSLRGVPLWHMDLRTMSLPPGTAPFGGFWTAATLLHIPKAEIPHVLGKMRAMLQLRAAGFIAVKDGSGEEYRTTPDVPARRFFAYWDAPALLEALGKAGYEILRYALRPAGPGSDAAWHQLLVRCAPLFSRPTAVAASRPVTLPA